MTKHNSYHTLEVKYLGATANRGSRIKISYIHEKRDSVTIPFDYKFNSALDKALDYLENKGAYILGINPTEKPDKPDIVIIAYYIKLK